MRLDVRSFALVCAIIWGIGLFCLTWWVIAFEGMEEAAALDTIINKAYRGFTFTPLGSVIGLGWAFVDGLIGGAVFAWLYNLLARRGAA